MEVLIGVCPQWGVGGWFLFSFFVLPCCPCRWHAACCIASFLLFFSFCLFFFFFVVWTSGVTHLLSWCAFRPEWVLSSRMGDASHAWSVSVSEDGLARVEDAGRPGLDGASCAVVLRRVGLLSHPASFRHDTSSGFSSRDLTRIVCSSLSRIPSCSPYTASRVGAHIYIRCFFRLLFGDAGYFWRRTAYVCDGLRACYGRRCLWRLLFSFLCFRTSWRVLPSFPPTSTLMRPG
ncbi:hypothetical protein B0H11DRAFT_331451 [Mycena galericulata]|nr:hypothetical protein B0H11DRAFT_331451 [Mycena galericulata]